MYVSINNGYDMVEHQMGSFWYQPGTFFRDTNRCEEAIQTMERKRHHYHSRRSKHFEKINGILRNPYDCRHHELWNGLLDDQSVNANGIHVALQNFFVVTYSYFSVGQLPTSGILGTPKYHVVSHSEVFHTSYGHPKKPCGCH